MQTYLFALSSEPPCSSLVLTFAVLTLLVKLLRFLRLLQTVHLRRFPARRTYHLASPLVLGYRSDYLLSDPLVLALSIQLSSD